MPKTHKSWQEKLRDSSNGLPMVEPMPLRMVRTLGEGTLCVPSPLEVDEIMHSVPRGKLITFNQIRRLVAERHSATVG
jgi:hypothetical protein